MRSILVLLLFALPAFCQDVPLELKGDTQTVKVDKVIIVKEDRTVLRSFPATITAPKGGILYTWQIPAGVEVVKKGNAIELKSAPKGSLHLAVEWAVVDFERKTVDQKFGSITFDVLEPGPGPGPKPDPPKPDIDPAPFPSDGLRAMLIYETAESTPSLNDVMSGNKTNDYMAAKGAKNGFMKLDKDVDVSGLPQWAKDAWKVPRTTLPWLIISNGKVGYSGVVPKDGGQYSPAKTLELLQKYGG